jgi:DNA-binding NtrC family response regulator
VLVVDDEPLALWSIAETLSERGDIVTEVKNGAAALIAMASPSAPVDVILLDYRLPDCRDLGLLAALRRITPGCPIILMTAHGTPAIAREALELGAYRVVDKPFELHDVADLIHEAHDASRPTSQRS